ncbi:30S ribosomal protein S12 methylthiotransferase RimO [Nitratifractor salsuginis]|uniref:Ribosomal protein uS12 methylthiotransferase RimO n=1 Tax=Nitratifractor salsuginis (strain DSM 16511 / JCM 12458 / E9I37-1) TaxID=749222 RepID=E6X383_NITSE|nr:30S ribosomal protein S12 methylthiotransferase RimO [Nitratifractor salsuginis]ADV47296.1 SSU ribosomal protein S12P methylthiotransferase [Nitratifractor salsuginis DSM 16511]
MSKKLHLVSLGCTKNLVDSEVMLGKLADYELSDEPAEADVIIVNTCGFIEAAKEESIATVLDLHERRKEDSLLVMSGCLSERYKEQLQKEMPEIDIFTGVGDYERIDELIRQKQSTFSPQVYLATEKSPRLITGSNYHAYIKIAEGCNQNCSFCAIPSFKGRLQSRTLDSIVAEVSALTAKGFYDFSFISQDSSSYGRDLGMRDGLIDLIRHMEQIPGVRSARILYLYPSTTSFELIDAIADSPVFQTYYDMPIQHIDDRVLKTMKRGFGEAKTRELLEAMRSKEGSFVRTSVIAGHPGESEESFRKLCDFLESFGFDRINVFAYSNEEETAAYEMEQLPEEVITRRTEILGEIAQRSRDASLERMIGRRCRLAIDGPSQEHEYLLSARPLLWAPEIDGEVLVNDTNDLDVKIGGLYQGKITEKAGEYLLASLETPLTE